MNRLPTWGVALLMLGGCTTGLVYQTPAANVGSMPSIDHQDPALVAGAPQAMWWKGFADPTLDKVIEAAWRGNFDLRIASAHAEAYLAQSQAASAAQWPAVGLAANASRERLSASNSHTGLPVIVNPVGVAALLSWELDLFGRVRHAVEAAKASAEEWSAMRDDVRRLILAKVLLAYLDLRGAQMQTTCLQKQLDNQNRTLSLVRDRESAGGASSAERVRFEAAVNLVASRLPLFKARERAARNRLATLTGLPLDAPELRELDRPTPLTLPRTLLTDEPANLLLNRPDIRAAERALAAATAQQGLAEAERFPVISLGALLGLAGTAGGWRNENAHTWRVGADMDWPLFDAGAARARARGASAEVQAAWAAYDKAVAVALEEADTAVSDWLQLKQSTAQLELAHAQASESARLARIRYQEGAESLLGVLDAERTALSAQEQLVNAQQEFGQASARSYIAMAGGLDPEGPR